MLIELLIASSSTPHAPAHTLLNYSSAHPRWLLINSSKLLHNEVDKGDLHFPAIFSKDSVNFPAIFKIFDRMWYNRDII